ncbi:hypothetical protein [Ancylomarina sp. 16SWW S1-10-2]|uniref:hypothetical protein n=1 Tax=Ancylomarina sp. 16SWW S1-10-2 TaxID=2499681 RepID=UPI0012AD6D13|nr:hypothetical protein [Ancylomarina sp. 16SWW S1-10-2]MRT94532.1 hypothetical protein [Ancylomarina sp. 16SWW S1-10-2]
MKRLLKITMVLAISLIAFGTYAADAIHGVGSIHKFKVNVDASNVHLTDHIGNIYTWAVYKADKTTAAVSGKDYLFTSAGAGVDENTADIQWLQGGTFFVEVTEANAAGACTTLRRLEIEVSTGALDLMVSASDAVGTTVSGVALTSCNGGSGALIDNVTNDFGSTTRYFTVKMTSDNQPFTTGTWGFDFTPSPASTVSSSTGGTVSGSSVTVAPGTSQVILTVVTANTPGKSPANDITLNLVASNAYITLGTVTTNEDETKNGANNTPDSFVITASPETSVIAID